MKIDEASVEGEFCDDVVKSAVYELQACTLREALASQVQSGL
jgi:hypothetical protein